MILTRRSSVMKNVRIMMALALMVILPSLGSAQAGGKIAFDNENHDFGKVLYGEKATHTFVVTNLGDDVLRITKVDVDCGCTKAVKGDTVIAPKGTSEITVEFDTEGERSGKKEKSVFVSSTDPSRPTVKLSLASHVVRELELDPPTFAKKLQKFEENLSIPLKITNLSDSPRTVTGIKTTANNVTAALESEKLTIAPNSTVTFNVVLHLKPQYPAPYLGKILLDTDHPREKQVDVRFLIQVLTP